MVSRTYRAAIRIGEDFITMEERQEKGRRLFIVGVTVDGETIAAGRGFNKKDASQMAAQLAAEKLGL